MRGPSSPTTVSARQAVLLCLLAIALTIWQHAAWGRGARAWPERLVVRLLSPALITASAIAAGLGDLAISIAASGRLGRENKWLREEAARLRADNIRLAELAAENAHLRQLLNTPMPANLEFVAVAEVVARSPGLFTRRIRIRAASGVELAKDDIILSGGCLVGRILDVTGPIAEAVLIVDQQHAVAAIDQRSRDQGMLYAQPPSPAGLNLLRMEKIVGAFDVAVGDLILTSGLGQVYPKGIPIGRVSRVVANPASTRVVTALVKPFVDIERLEFVTVARVTAPR